jgi:ubiquinone biosynthesis protein
MLKALADYGRLMRAGAVMSRHDVILPGEYQGRIPLPARLFGRLMRLTAGGAKGRPGERLARALEKLGPAYIKLGQFIATRPDVFGVETTQDLSTLKDKLPSFGLDKARETLAAEFPGEHETFFPELSEPVAAASLAQVHRMRVDGGERAVKILRPNIDARIETALRAMARAARNIETVNRDSRRLKPVAFVHTVSESMRKELDLRLEAGGTDELREISEKHGFFRVPDVDWQRSSRRVLCTSWVDGVPLTDTDRLNTMALDRPGLADKVTRGFLSSAIYDGVFHADMHEGNMMVTADGDLWLLDFGIVGRIGPDERRFLAEILYGFIRRDYTKIAEVHFEAGYVPPDRDVGDFAQALRSVGEPIFGKTAEDVSMGRLLLQLFDITHQFGMAMRPELVLLQKTMVQVEGVARGLDPGHDIWKAAKPIVEKWVRRELGPEGVAKRTAEAAYEVALRLQKMPEILDGLEALVKSSRKPG